MAVKLSEPAERGGGAMRNSMENFGFFLSRAFATTRPKRKSWPHVPGTYFVADPSAPVAVTTLGSVALAEAVSRDPPAGLCIVGKVETENIGIEKIIKNILSNPAIRYLVCAGNEPPRHLTGATLMALFANGIDERRRIPGSPGMRPVLPNTSSAEVRAFRDQVDPIDMIGCTDVLAIHARVAELAQMSSAKPVLPFRSRVPATDPEEGERVMAVGTDPQHIKLDEAGYFVIHVVGDALIVEHYSYKEKLLRRIEGRDARSIYLTLIRNGWVSRLDHAAYLGKELARAEWCLEHGLEFVQDGA
jgi:tetrahydromethanopterin S-methyltransferase subunit A